MSGCVHLKWDYILVIGIAIRKVLKAITITKHTNQETSKEAT